MKLLEQDKVLPALKLFSIAPLAWAAELHGMPGDVVSRLYIFAGEMGACITLCCSEISQVEVNALGTPAEEAPQWLQEYLGVFPVDGGRAQSIRRRLEELSVVTRKDCVTNSRDGILLFHVVITDTEEHCFEMSNPQLHEDVGYRKIVNLYSDEFLGGEIHL